MSSFGSLYNKQEKLTFPTQIFFVVVEMCNPPHHESMLYIILFYNIGHPLLISKNNTIFRKYNKEVILRVIKNRLRFEI